MSIPITERSEKEIAQIIRKKIEAMRDVRSFHKLSVHMTGKRFYVEMHILLDGNLRFEETHRIASNIEREVKNVVPNARVTIHTEPIGGVRESVWELVKDVAEGAPGSRGVHNIHIQEINGKLYVDLHLEVSADMTEKQAHDVSEQVENKLREKNPNIEEVTIHMESASELISRELMGVETDLEYFIEHVVERFPEIRSVHGIEVRKVGDNRHIVLRCHFDPNISMEKAHEISNNIEREIRSAYPRIARIDVHEEPT